VHVPHGPVSRRPARDGLDWPEIFAGDEILTTAILDRLLHHVAIVHIDGKSYRLRELDALLSPATESTTTVA